MTKKIKEQRQKYAKNEEVAPARICKKTNNANMSNLAKKSNEAMNKTIVKNKASKRLHI